MKALAGILCLNRPKTFELCVRLLNKGKDRSDYTLIIVDNGSDAETQEMVKRYEKDVDMVIRHEWNTGYAFGVNSWMSMRDEGQHCIQIDQDMLMYSPDWWTMFKVILQEPTFGFLAAHRPTAWIDREEKWHTYTTPGYMSFGTYGGLFLELPADNCLIAPILVYRGDMLDAMGFENEATGWGDMESHHRVTALGYKGAYLPEIFLYQVDFEKPTTLYKNAHHELLAKRKELAEKYIEHYKKKEKIFCGTHFLPLTMGDEEYKKYSDENWEFYREWVDK